MNFLICALFCFSAGLGRAASPIDQQKRYERLPDQQLFGAEVQYFRLRGGSGKNIPRAQVIDLWARALDAARDAKMNTVSFYVPWDFHEFAEGQFDFSGTVDQDGDGLPDYPSRDVQTFLQMIKDRGFQNVMVRPGPYINAEWGFLGFGAIPQWFHEKYPNSHMRNSRGQRTALYDYHNTDLHRHTQIWFKAVFENLLRGNLGDDGPIRFVQIDNETNFMWQSIYNHDYGKFAIERYQSFLKNRYSSINWLNLKHQRRWTQWSEIQAPVVRGANVAEDQDWYRFQDELIYLYLAKLRKIWEALGVREPQILFTLAESYNAAGHGVLPNYLLRNDDRTGLLTVNLYPKTDNGTTRPLHNQPFKADHDVLAQESASQAYFGTGQSWVMGPEVQGGWWKGTDVSAEARQQTYLSVLGHGMKALFVYYFNEGNNWETGWSREQLKPYFSRLRSTPAYRGFPENRLPKSFWQELQRISDNEIMAGIDVQREWTQEMTGADELFFDAPLDGQARPRNHYFDLQQLGQKIIAPYGQWLRQARSNRDAICLLKDSTSSVPSVLAAVDSVLVNSDWEAGLVGYVLNAGFNLQIFHWGINPESDLTSCRVILHQDSGQTSAKLANKLEMLVREGKTVINFLGDSAAAPFAIRSKNISKPGGTQVSFSTTEGGFLVRSQPLFQYAVRGSTGCIPVLQSRLGIHGYQCRSGSGFFYQVGALVADIFNSSEYASTLDIRSRVLFFKRMIASQNVRSAVRVHPETPAERVVAFSRSVIGEPQTYVTVKSGQSGPTRFRLQVTTTELGQDYRVTDVLSGTQQVVNGAELQRVGFEAALKPYGSTVFWIEPETAVAP